MTQVMANTITTVTSQTNNTTIPAELTCTEKLQENPILLDQYGALFAIGLIFILSWFEKRRFTCPTRCLGGRPGCLIPVNLLDGDRDRLSYAAAFGCTSSSIFSLLLSNIQFTTISTTSEELSALIFYLWIMAYAVVIGVTYYPLFVCLAPRFRFVHSTIGLGYTTLRLVISILKIKGYIECLPISEWVMTMTIIMLSLPEPLCLFYLALRFIYMLGNDVRTTVRACRQGNDESRILKQVSTFKNKVRCDRLANSKQLQHVKELFTRSDEPASPGTYISKCVDVIQLSYKGDRSFRCSHAVVVTFTVALICLYQISILVLGGGTSIIQMVERMGSQNTTDSIYAPFIEYMDTLGHVLKASFYISFTITTVMSGVIIFQIMISYRRNMEALFKGDFSCIPTEARRQSAVTVMTTNLHYPGTQIAYLFWSYLIQLGVLMIVCVGVAYLIVLPIVGDVPFSFIQPVLTVLTTTAIAFVTYWIQKVVSNKWLLQDHKVFNKTSKSLELVLALNNRKAYHNMAYFVFFYYIFIGIVRCLMKIFKGLVLGVVFFGRIDRSGLMNGFETWDTGYMAYVSFLQMELVHCHPVLVVFCDLICNRSPGNINVPLYSATSSLNHTRSTLSRVPKYNQRIHNRWLKAYTLLKNPSLVVKR